MDRFQVRNLMVQTLPSEGGVGIGVGEFAACPNIFTCAGGISCCLLTAVPYPSWARIAAAETSASPDELDVLKRQLRLAVARIDQRARDLEEQLKPQNLEEVARLEAEHKEALETLRARRDELTKSAK